jgi:hypothetical protein
LQPLRPAAVRCSAWLRFSFQAHSHAVRLLERFPLEFQQPLVRCQLGEQARLGRRVQERVDSQPDGGVCQQSHAPSQPQTVEEHLAQTQLIFLIRLCGFNPRTDPLQQLLRRLTGQRQQTEQRLMLVRSESKFARTLGGFPAARAESGTGGDTEPVPIFSRRIPQPVLPEFQRSGWRVLQWFRQVGRLLAVLLAVATRSFTTC